MFKPTLLTIIPLGVLVMLLLVASWARPTEIGVAVAEPGATCEDSVEAMKAVLHELKSLKEIQTTTTDTNGKLVIGAEMHRVRELGIKIYYWRNENCKES